MLSKVKGKENTHKGIGFVNDSEKYVRQKLVEVSANESAYECSLTDPFCVDTFVWESLLGYAKVQVKKNKNLQSGYTTLR